MLCPGRRDYLADGVPGRSWLVAITPKGATISNHFSAANLRFPGDDTRLDLTDVFAFRSAEDPGKTVTLDSEPYASSGRKLEVTLLQLLPIESLL